MIYTGVGSREIPPEIYMAMRRFGAAFAECSWLLRSGGAPGSDKAFEDGCDHAGGRKEIWVPYATAGDCRARSLTPTPAAFELAAKIHPQWNRLKPVVKQLHARNCHQVLGRDLNIPSRFVMCWTPNGEEVGGTRTAIVLAKDRGIPIYNLALDPWRSCKWDWAEIEVFIAERTREAA